MLDSLVLGVLFALAPAASPVVLHGGVFQPPTYDGPGDTVPPGASSPPSTPSTGGPSGPTTGGPGTGGPGTGGPGTGGPGTGGPGTGGPTKPAGPGTGAPPTTGGPNTPAGPGNPPPGSGPTTGGEQPKDPASWAIWWEFHKDPYLQIKRAIHSTGAVETGDAGFFTGRGSAKLQLDTLRPSPEQIRDEALPALPALLALLESESDPNVITGSLIAIARIGAGRAGESEQAATPTGSSSVSP